MRRDMDVFIDFLDSTQVENREECLKLMKHSEIFLQATVVKASDPALLCKKASWTPFGEKNGDLGNPFLDRAVREGTTEITERKPGLVYLDLNTGVCQH
jgi:hypothetical protein